MICSAQLARSQIGTTRKSRTWWFQTETFQNAFHCLYSKIKSFYRARLWGLLWETMLGNTKFMKFYFVFRKNCLHVYMPCSLRMIDSRLLRKDTLSSVVIGVVPRRSDKEVCWIFCGFFLVLNKLEKLTFVYVFCCDLFVNCTWRHT